MRRSVAPGKNDQLGDWSNWAKDRDNLEFITEALQVMDKDFGVSHGGEMVIGLVGSRDLPGTTVRHAQSVLRWDRRPSLWSHIFLIAKPWTGKGKIENVPVLEVPLVPRTGEFPHPETNGLNVDSTLGAYANHKLDANIALIAVAMRQQSKNGKVTNHALDAKDVKAVAGRARDPNYDRLRYDLWDGLCAWQRFLWSQDEGVNPLRAGIPFPASAYVEMAYEAIGLDLVPAASERNSAPEHIWNAAVWWLQEKQMEATKDDLPHVMTGCFALRDPGCSMLSQDEKLE